MLINLRNALMAAKRWKNPYNTDGLIAMYDGEWNAGGGVHNPDETTTRWVNLGSLGEDFDATRDYGTFTAKAASFTRTISTRNTFAIPNYLMRDYMKGEWSVECVFMPTSQWFQDYAGVFGNHTPATKGLVFGQHEGSNIVFNLYGPLVYLYSASQSTFTAGVTYAVSQSASNTINTATTWRNGVQVSRSTGVNVMLNYAEDARTCIGAAFRTHIQDESGTNRSFDGLIHCVRVYNRPIDAQTVAANYAIDKARFGLP